jgi:outer membrane protein
MKQLPSIRFACGVLVAMLAVLFAGVATAEDLLQVYREAQKSDPALAAARSQWEATQERVPQARSALLPNVALSGSGTYNNYDATIRSDPKAQLSANYAQGNLTFSASQPLYRPQNVVVLNQARELVSQADYVLAIAQQDLILRTAIAYFDVLLAEFNVELVEQQKLAVDEQLAQAKRNFEVGTATITDTNEAQAKYDSIIATEIQFRNDLERRRTALRAIIGRYPTSLQRIGRAGFDPALPTPNNVEFWVDKAARENLSVRIQQGNYDIASLEVDRAKAGHYPTVDLVASYGAQGSNGSVNNNFTSDSRSGLIGLQLNVPLYQGGFVNSRVRESISLQDKSRADLETVRRAAITNAQDGFSGVNSAVAGVKAFEQAVASAEVALQSNILGQEVGIRTNLDVLNVQQNVYSTRRDLANAYFQYLLAVLRLKAAVGSLNEVDLEELNRRLNG